MQTGSANSRGPHHPLPRVGKTERNVYYVWFFQRPYVHFLLMAPALALAFTRAAYVSFPLLVLAVLAFKGCGSLRLYPLLVWLKMDERYVYLALSVRWQLKKLSLEEIYITEARYHGLRYILFSPVPVTDTRWKAVAKNRDIIAYPFCGGMKLDFPELFRYIPCK